MLNFPKDQAPKNREKRKKYEKIELSKREKFQYHVKNEIKKIHSFPVIQKLPLNVFPIPQKCSSQYSDLPYGKIGNVKEAACAPLALEYALRLIGINIDFKEILNECVAKDYRGYIHDENDNIIEGNGTKYSLFCNLAVECQNIKDILYFLNKGVPITVLIQNCVYKDDENAKGSHFITLIGIDENKNAILMDGNRIEDEDNPKVALVRKSFYDIASGLRGAWAWNEEKIKAYL